MRRLAVIVAVVAGVSVLAGCGTEKQHAAVPSSSPAKQSQPAQPAQPVPAPAPRKPAAPTCDPSTPLALGSATTHYAAVVRTHATAYTAPGGSPIRTFGKKNANKFTTVFEVTQMLPTSHCKPAWYRVQLPLRPNGRTGWVRPWAVVVLPVKTRIVIHVKAAKLDLYKGNRRVMTTAIAPGAPDTPTPLGEFYVTQRLVPANPNGAYGPAALGTSAFSPVLKNWTQGGPIGIHGTDEPWVIGHPASHGCIRLPNDAMKKLFDYALAGTPIQILA